MLHGVRTESAPREPSLRGHLMAPYRGVSQVLRVQSESYLCNHKSLVLMVSIWSHVSDGGRFLGAVPEAGHNGRTAISTRLTWRVRLVRTLRTFGGRLDRRAECWSLPSSLLCSNRL